MLNFIYGMCAVVIIWAVKDFRDKKSFKTKMLSELNKLERHRLANYQR